MFIFGFPLQDEKEWQDDPFEYQENTPESDICEVCHIYKGVNGQKYIGIDMSLGLPLDEMKEMLLPFSDNLDIRKVTQ